MTKSGLFMKFSRFTMETSWAELARNSVNGMRAEFIRAEAPQRTVMQPFPRGLYQAVEVRYTAVLQPS